MSKTLGVKDERILVKPDPARKGLSSPHKPNQTVADQLANNHASRSQVGSQLLHFPGLQTSFQTSEVVRLTIQALKTMGFDASARSLEAESGVRLLSDAVQRVMDCIRDGDWSKALENVDQLDLGSVEAHKLVFLIHRQRFFEALFRSDPKSALACLQSNLTPLIDQHFPSIRAHLHELTRLLVVGDGFAKEVVRLARSSEPILFGTTDDTSAPPPSNSHLNDDTWSVYDSREYLVQVLHHLLPNDLLLPENRLFSLLDDAVKHQESMCMYNTLPLEEAQHGTPLLEDLQDIARRHEQLPVTTLQELDAHSDQVWCVQFSPGGTMLASSSKDASIVIWSVNTDGCQADAVEDAPSNGVCSRGVNGVRDGGVNGMRDGGVNGVRDGGVNGTRDRDGHGAEEDPRKVEQTRHGVAQTRRTTRSSATHNENGPHTQTQHTSCDDNSGTRKRDASGSNSNNHKRNVNETLPPPKQHDKHDSTNHHGHDVGVLTMKCLLTHKQGPANRIAWSPDEKHFASCSDEGGTICIWDVSSGGSLVREINRRDPCPYSTICWINNDLLLSGSLDRHLDVWTLDGRATLSYKDVEIYDAVVCEKYNLVVLACPGHQVRFIDLQVLLQSATDTDGDGGDDQDAELIEGQPPILLAYEESDNVASIQLSADGELLLFNLVSNELHVWSLAKMQPGGMLVGHIHERLIIRSCMTGTRQQFAACGSEDSNVYIWRYVPDREKSYPVRVLHGHRGAVNDVAFCSQDPRILVSASDDHTIRVWGVPRPRRSTNASSSSFQGYKLNGNVEVEAPRGSPRPRGRTRRNMHLQPEHRSVDALSSGDETSDDDGQRSENGSSSVHTETDDNDDDEEDESDDDVSGEMLLSD